MNNPLNNFSNKGYGTDDRLWACANNLTSFWWGSRELSNFANFALAFDSDKAFLHMFISCIGTLTT